MVETEMVMPGLANVNWYRVATTIMNRAEVKILELSKEEMLEDELRDLVDPEDVRKFLDVAKEKVTDEIYFWWKGRWVKHNDLNGKMANIMRT